MEVWKQDRTGRFALLNAYPVCKFSGKLGPKITEGDRQAPEVCPGTSGGITKFSEHEAD